MAICPILCWCTVKFTTAKPGYPRLKKKTASIFCPRTFSNTLFFMRSWDDIYAKIINGNWETVAGVVDSCIFNIFFMTMRFLSSLPSNRYYSLLPLDVLQVMTNVGNMLSAGLLWTEICISTRHFQTIYVNTARNHVTTLRQQARFGIINLRGKSHTHTHNFLNLIVFYLWISEPVFTHP